MFSVSPPKWGRCHLVVAVVESAALEGSSRSPLRRDLLLVELQAFLERRAHADLRFAQKLEQLKRAREAKRLKRLQKNKQPPVASKPVSPEQVPQPEVDVETVYVKRSKTKVQKQPPPKPRRKKKIVYVESSSSSDEDSSSSEEEVVQYVKRRSRKPKQRLSTVHEEPAQQQPPSMFQYHNNGDVVW